MPRPLGLHYAKRTTPQMATNLAWAAVMRGFCLMSAASVLVTDVRSCTHAALRCLRPEKRNISNITPDPDGHRPQRPYAQGLGADMCQTGADSSSCNRADTTRPRTRGNARVSGSRGLSPVLARSSQGCVSRGSKPSRGIAKGDRASTTLIACEAVVEPCNLVENWGVLTPQSCAALSMRVRVDPAGVLR